MGHTLRSKDKKKWYPRKGLITRNTHVLQLPCTKRINQSPTLCLRFPLPQELHRYPHLLSRKHNCPCLDGQLQKKAQTIVIIVIIHGHVATKTQNTSD